jgi:hypothetical protein
MTIIVSVPFSYRMSYAGVPFARILDSLGLLVALTTTVGFAISAAIARTHRWRHVFVVAVGVWLTGIVNVVFMPHILLSWLFALIPLLMFAAIGVGLSFLFVRPHRDGHGPLAQSGEPGTPTPPEQS